IQIIQYTKFWSIYFLTFVLVNKPNTTKIQARVQYAPESVLLLTSQIAQRSQHAPESNVRTLQNAKRSISSIHIFFEISQERGSTCSGICLMLIELSGWAAYAGMSEC
ncbi:MAG TPA: hypothetical protein PKV31_08455, partial [Saprospiraceae bacterium]|nr:hypothetical protein [Saprospiraceae bacterium]